MTSEGNPKNLVQSLAKGFRVLEAFTATDTEFTLNDISVRTGLDSGTVFRMVHTLISLGHLQRVDNTRRFRLSLKVLDLGFNAIAQTDLRDMARPILWSLVGDVSEAASLAVLDGSDMVYLERVHAGLARLGVDIRIGTRLPAYYTAVGHAVLAYLPGGAVLKVLNMCERVKFTPATPVNIEEITGCLERVRRQGYAVADPRVVLGLRVLAAPVLDADGQSVAAISVAAPAMKVTLRKFVDQTAGPLLKAVADMGKVMELSGAGSPGAVSAV